MELRERRRDQVHGDLVSTELTGGIYEDAGYVFANELGQPLRPDAVSVAFRRHVAAAGLPPNGLHGLRHAFATLALEGGVDSVYVSAILGHASPSITAAIYQHARTEKLSPAVTAVAEAIHGFKLPLHLVSICALVAVSPCPPRGRRRSCW